MCHRDTQAGPETASSNLNILNYANKFDIDFRFQLSFLNYFPSNVLCFGKLFLRYIMRSPISGLLKSSILEWFLLSKQSSGGFISIILLPGQCDCSQRDAYSCVRFGFTAFCFILFSWATRAGSKQVKARYFLAA